jgi:hypothetical protein
MSITMHRLLDRAHFEMHWNRRLSFRERILALARSGEGDFEGCHTTVMNNSIELGCIALILGKSDAEAAAEFGQAVSYALTLVTGHGTSHPFTSHEVLVDPEETGGQTVTMREHHFPAGSPLDPTYYLVALAAIIAFGTEDQRRIAAEYPEERYRNPNVKVDESLFLKLRALKALSRGDDNVARREGLAALKVCRDASARPGIMALASLIDRDEARFRDHLEDAVKAYKRMYQGSPNDAEGFVYLLGLALCRLAVERGIIVEDGPYLPTRLLPEAGGQRVH